MAHPAKPARIFISYAREDEDLREKLEKQLAILRRQGLIETWHDRRIGAGSEWAGAIDRELEAADIILLLVSADFLASDYIYDIELKRAMERHEAGTATVIPVILRPCLWQRGDFAKLQALPRDGEPVTSSKWPSQDAALNNVAEGIARVVEASVLEGLSRHSAELSVWIGSTLACASPAARMPPLAHQSERS